MPTSILKKLLILFSPLLVLRWFFLALFRCPDASWSWLRSPDTTWFPPRFSNVFWFIFRASDTFCSLLRGSGGFSDACICISDCIDSKSVKRGIPRQMKRLQAEKARRVPSWCHNRNQACNLSISDMDSGPPWPAIGSLLDNPRMSPLHLRQYGWG